MGPVTGSDSAKLDLSHEVEGIKVKNCLLLLLRGADFQIIKPLIQRVPLRRGLVLQERNRAVDSAYFIESGAASLSFRTRRDGAVGVAIIARYGIVGLPAVLGTVRSPHRCVVQIPGEALRISSADLESAMAASVPLRRVLNRYIQALLVQHAQTVLCVSRHSLEERLSSWLIAMSDRVGSDRIAITHDLVAQMLGVRRPGITAAIGRLEAAGAVTKSRGQIRVADRANLEALSCECYSSMRSEYVRLLDKPIAEGRRKEAPTISPHHVL